MDLWNVKVQMLEGVHVDLSQENIEFPDCSEHYSELWSTNLKLPVKVIISLEWHCTHSDSAWTGARVLLNKCIFAIKNHIWRKSGLCQSLCGK